MRYLIYSIVASLAAIALYPVMKKFGRYLLSLFKKIDDAAKDTTETIKVDKDAK